MTCTNSCCRWLVCTVLVVCLTSAISATLDSSITSSSPGNLHHGSNSSLAPQVIGSKETHYRAQTLPLNHYINTFNLNPGQIVSTYNYRPAFHPGNRWPTWNLSNNNNYRTTPFPDNRWPNWNLSKNNNYRTTPHPSNRWPTWNPRNYNNYPQTPHPGIRWPIWHQGKNNNYRTTPHPGNRWPTWNPGNRWPTWNPGQNTHKPTTPQPDNQFSTRPPKNSSTQHQSWTRGPSMKPPVDRGDQFDLIDFQNLPDSYKTAFMSVEELLRNNGMISPPGPNSKNVLVVFDNRTHRILDSSLESMVSNILPTLVPGTWRSLTYIQGCCSALRYHSANETLVNINGQPKKIVHFSKYNPPMYQFIPHGLCAHTNYSTDGHCIQGTVTMSLLVYDLRFNPPISFDIFSIPSYCNCVQY